MNLIVPVSVTGSELSVVGYLCPILLHLQGKHKGTAFNGCGILIPAGYLYLQGKDKFNLVILAPFTVHNQGFSARGRRLAARGREVFRAGAEEGEDGVLLTTEAGDTYHFTPYDMPPVIASVTLNTEGLGRVAYAEEGGELVLDGDPYQSAVINVAEPAVYQIGARAEDGWTFVKWTKNGEDFTTEPVFTITIEESADFVAVFEEAQ